MFNRTIGKIVFIFLILFSSFTFSCSTYVRHSGLLPQTEETIDASQEVSFPSKALEIISSTFELENQFPRLKELIWISDMVIFILLLLLSTAIIALSFKAQVLAEKRKRVLRSRPFSASQVHEIEHIAHSRQNKWRRIGAIALLHHINKATALDILSKTLYDLDRDVSYFSMLALGRIRTPESARILLHFLKKDIFNGQKIVSLLEDFPLVIVDEIMEMTRSQNATVRFWAIKLLTKFKPVREFQRIAAFTEDPSPNVRSAACECLGELRKKEAKNLLIKRLNDQVWFVRMQAVRALFKIFGPESIPDLVQLMARDDSTFVKESVKDVIVSDIEQALPYIQECLYSQNLGARKYCIDALIDANYVHPLLANVISSNLEVQKKAKKLLESMIRSGVYFGLKKTLDAFVPASRAKILAVISSMDKNLALRIHSEAKLKNAG